MIKITKNINEASFVTHAGVFHADDIFSTALLHILNGDMILYRANTNDEANQAKSTAIIYDIGEGKFDHHQVDSECRPTGAKYASFGLLWREFGQALCQTCAYPSKAFKDFDKSFVAYIDAIDTGNNEMFASATMSISISTIISAFNPNWDADESEDEAFLKAVTIAETILTTMLDSLLSKNNAKDYVEPKIANSSDHIMILDVDAPWKAHLYHSKNEKAQDILYVISPSKRGGYSISTVPIQPTDRTPKMALPNAWHGKTVDELNAMTGYAFTFCHKNLFMACAATLDDAINIAKLAIKIQTEGDRNE